MNNLQKIMIYIVLFFMTVLVDCLGSTIALTDQDKSITDRFSYDPWGYCIHSIGDSDTPFKYVGAFGIQTDPNGLVNMRARYYNPATKSFISADPSGFEGGLNWYLYASGDPFSRVDINGMWDGSIMSAGAEQMSTWGMSVAQTMMVNQSLSQEYWSTPTAQVARATIPFVDTYANYSMGNSVSPVSLAMDIASVIPIGRIAGVASKSIGSASALAKTASVGRNVYKSQISTSMLVQQVATRAENYIGGKGAVAGIKKHAYAKKFLDTYQRIYGNRGLELEKRVQNARPDVRDPINKIIYDFKFGNANMSSSQYMKYTTIFDGYEIVIVRP